MRRLALLLVVIAALCPAALAEPSGEAMLGTIGLDRLATLFEDSSGVDVMSIARDALSGKLDLDALLPRGIVSELVQAFWRGVTGTLAALAAPLLASLLSRATLVRSAGSTTLLSRVACALGLLRGSARAFDAARQALGLASKALDRLGPVLASALELSGAGATAAILSPASALGAGMIEEVLRRWGLPVCGLALAVAAAGNLSEGICLERLFALLKRFVVMGVGLLAAAFTGLLALEGRLAGPQDSTLTRALQQAIRGMVPIIGGEVSGAAGALVGSSVAVRNAVGVTGMIAVLAACGRPMVRLAIHALSVKLAAALAEPLAEPGIARLCSAFGDVAEMLLAICCGGIVPALLLGGACLGAASGIAGI